MKISRISPEVLYLSLFGVGFIRYAPGTFGTLAALPMIMTLSHFNVPPFLLAPVFCLAAVAACFMANHVRKKFCIHDPSWIVIDEVLGIGFAWMLLVNSTFVSILVLFFLFRLFDILKPFPANIVDKRVRHGAGVILDDIICGFYAGCALRFVIDPYVLTVLSG